MIVALLSKLLLPLVALLVISGAGIVTLIVEWARSDEEPVASGAGPATTRVTLSGARTSSASIAGEHQDTVRVRTGTTLPPTPAPRREPTPPPPPPPRREPTPPPTTRPEPPTPNEGYRSATPTIPVRPGGPPPAPAASEQAPRGNKMGTNIVVNLPTSRVAGSRTLGRLEVIYGNFSPTDPREIELFTDAGPSGETRFTFSKSARDSVFHIQLNHYTVSPVVHSEIVLQNGRCTLVNLVPDDEADRYQTRINGTPLETREDHVLSPGDIVSMGIFRLKMGL